MRVMPINKPEWEPINKLERQHLSPYGNAHQPRLRFAGPQN